MRAMLLKIPANAENFPLLMENVPQPDPGKHEVLLQVLACGVCHTDLHIIEGDLVAPSYPVIPGHQVVGRVMMAGESVAEGLIGQRVGAYWMHSACGKCEYCLRGLENLCPSAQFTGFHVNGGFAEYILADARFIVPIPQAFTDEQAAPLLCAGMIGYRSLKKSDLEPGERLGLFGFGASAHLVLQIARHWNCEVSVFTRSKAHQQHALEMGAAWAGTVDQIPDKLLDRAILFAPTGDLVPAALKSVRPGGTVAINAIHLSLIPAMPYGLIYGERTLRSVANVTRKDASEFMSLAQEIGIHSTVQLYDLAEANRALADLKSSRFNGEAVLRVGY